MEWIVKASAWKIFILLIVGAVLMSFTYENDTDITLMLNNLGLVLYIVYPFSIAYYLFDYIPKRLQFSYTLFLINSVLLLGTLIVTSILSNGEGMSFNGIMAIPFFYLFYAFIHYFAYPVKIIKTIELEKKATISDYIGDFFLLLFTPIGVWFIQPRVRFIVSEKQLEEIKA